MHGRNEYRENLIRMLACSAFSAAALAATGLSCYSISRRCVMLSVTVWLRARRSHRVSPLHASRFMTRLGAAAEAG